MPTSSVVSQFIIVDGLKFHNTGKVTIRNSLLADNQYHVRYGAFNSIVTLQNSTIDAISADYKYRLNQGSDNSRHTRRGIYSSINSDVNKDDVVPDSLALYDVTFQNFRNSQTFEFYKDDRNYNTRGFGNPVNATGVSIINSERSSYPKFKCGMSYYHSYMEDDAGTLIAPDEPFHGESGFIVAGREGMVAFLPDGSCEPISYSGSNSYQPDGCSYYCKNVCLRSVEIEPRGLHAYSKMKLVKEDGKEWTMTYNGRNKVSLIAHSSLIEQLISKSNSFLTPQFYVVPIITAFRKNLLLGSSSWKLYWHFLRRKR